MSRVSKVKARAAEVFGLPRDMPVRDMLSSIKASYSVSYVLDTGEKPAVVTMLDRITLLHTYKPLKKRSSLYY